VITSATFKRSTFKLINVKTLIIKVDPNDPDIDKLKIASEIIKKGGLVAFPTETVYGLGANALNESAVRRIFEVKQRPPDNPLSILVADFDTVYSIAELNVIAKRLMDEFFPGPITIIAKKKPVVPDITTGGQDKVAVRMPDHKVALKIIELSETPIAAPSANLSGKPSPTKAEHVLEDFEGKIDAIVDGGETGIGIESTVVDTTTMPIRILRLGAIAVEDIENVVGEVEVVEAPSMKYAHYKPNARLITVFGDDRDRVVAKIAELVDDFKEKRLKVGVAVRVLDREIDADEVIEIGDDLMEIARKLFGILRDFDKKGVDVIVMEGVDGGGIARTIGSRLKKASDEVCRV